MLLFFFMADPSTFRPDFGHIDDFFPTFSYQSKVGWIIKIRVYDLAVESAVPA
jgi:hypothetical protein